jgi:glycosyltransferase involved in cell wall biosynthesis
VSHTFILGEVLGLRRLGVEVHTLAIRRSPPEEVLSAADRDAEATTYYVLPVRPWHLLRAHVRALVRAPDGYVTTLLAALALGRADLRALLWQLFYFAEAMLVWDQCRRRDVRHLHIHFPNVAADVAMLVCRYGGEEWSYSLTLHGPTEFADVRAYNLAEKVGGSQLTICISHYTRSQVMNLVDPAHWDKLAVVHCGIDTARFAPRPETNDGQGPPTILAVGRLDHRKAHRLLVEALALLRARGIEARAVVVGEGPERSALERQADDLGVRDRLSLPGAVGQDEIDSWFAAADVFCLPSLAEGLPVVLMEAMACGLPVVAPRLMGIPELVEDSVSGVLVTPARADELADALERLLANGELRRSLGAAGRERVVAEFDADACAREVADHMREALRG